MAEHRMKRVKEIPASNRGKYERQPDKQHLKMVKALQAHPYEWVSIRTYDKPASASRFATKVHRSEYLAFKDGKYEARSVAGIVYARYMGPV